MDRRENLITFKLYGWHKGFYQEEDIGKSLSQIRYSDFFIPPDDDDFPYDSAFPLLYGSCNHFAISLQKVFGYNAYIIESIDGCGFHAFCQVYESGIWYYVDARGITTSFDEFMTVAKEFVKDEYTIKPVTSNIIEEWENYSDYNDEAYAFAEAVIKKFKNYYSL